jgi:HK97 gp10 family phage protein
MPAPGAYLVFDDFPKIAAQLLPAADRIVRATAFRIEAGAKARAPVDTGMLKNSIYTATSQGVGARGARTGAAATAVASGLHAYRVSSITQRTRAQAAGAGRVASFAKGIKGIIRRDVFPAIGAPPVGTALVAVGAEYGAYVEYGTRHTGSRPFLTPAVEAQRASFEQALGQIVAQSAGGR